jgi:hypothetical protein
MTPEAIQLKIGTSNLTPSIYPNILLKYITQSL